MNHLMEVPNNLYLERFNRLEHELASVGSSGVQRLRKAAIARFAERGFPNERDEEWRFTNVWSLATTDYEPVSDAFEYEARQLPPCVVVCSFAEAFRKRPDLVETYLGRYADYKEHCFTALNTAFFRNGLFVYIPAGTVVDGPIHLKFHAESHDLPSVAHRRLLVVVGDGSQVQLVESYDGPEKENYFTNAVTEIIVGKGAHIDHYKLQREGSAASHMSLMQVQLDRESQFTSHAVNLGGAWVRNEINAVFGAERAECTLNGLYQASDKQFIDNHTFIDHAYPHCASHEVYKGILDGKARGVFNGKIYVREDAQKTDAKQTNKTLLLSDDATINTKPQLEIYADDVKCTHGATVRTNRPRIALLSAFARHRSGPRPGAADVRLCQ